MSSLVRADVCDKHEVGEVDTISATDSVNAQIDRLENHVRDIGYKMTNLEAENLKCNCIISVSTLIILILYAPRQCCHHIFKTSIGLITNDVFPINRRVSSASPVARADDDNVVVEIRI